MRPADIIVLVIFVGALVLYGGGFFEEESTRPAPSVVAAPEARNEPLRRPATSKHDSRRPLPAPRPGRDPVILIESGEPEGNTVGTAFSLDSDGVWMTARHVVDGCDRLGLQTPARPTVWIDEARSSSRVDLAILVADLPGPSFSMSDRLPDLGETGYGVGYPQGSPGDVSGSLIGRAVSRSTGRFNIEEPVLVWAERSRFPSFEGSLAGISGGPLLSREGTVVGVIISGSPRRGRFNTSAPRAIQPVVDAAPITLDGDDEILSLERAVGRLSLSDLGDQLRDIEAVARVVCIRD